jgi:hypothetical protein
MTSEAAGSKVPANGNFCCHGAAAFGLGFGLSQGVARVPSRAPPGNGFVACGNLGSSAANQLPQSFEMD